MHFVKKAADYLREHAQNEQAEILYQPGTGDL